MSSRRDWFIQSIPSHLPPRLSLFTSGQRKPRSLQLQKSIRLHHHHNEKYIISLSLNLAKNDKSDAIFSSRDFVRLIRSGLARFWILAEGSRLL